MSQSFLTYNEQIEKLKKEKNLKIDNEKYAVSMLKRLSYFALIGGYKDLLKNKTTRKFKDNTCFEDIVALYKFDENLRELFLKYLLKIERHFRSLISYNFCEKYGENQKFYLDKKSYTTHSKHDEKVNKLIGKLNKLANESSDYKYINYQREKHRNVPLWVLFNGVTFGTLSKFYFLMTDDLKYKVSLEFPDLLEKQIGQILNFLTKFRNVCAHNERLFSYKVKKSDIPNLKAHKILNITKEKDYIKGKKDLFAVVISFKYMLEIDDFKNFKQDISAIIENYVSKTKSIKKDEILEAMGFPNNWYEI